MKAIWRFDDWYLVDIGEDGKPGYQPKSKRINPGDDGYDECVAFEAEHPDLVVISVTKVLTDKERQAQVIAQRKAAYVETDALRLELEYDAYKNKTELDLTTWYQAVSAIKEKYPLEG